MIGGWVLVVTIVGRELEFGNFDQWDQVQDLVVVGLTDVETVRSQRHETSGPDTPNDAASTGPT